MANITNEELIKKAASVIRPKKLKDGLVGDVGCALLSRNGKMYTGVCVGLNSNGYCAERVAIAKMITDDKEFVIKKIVATWNDEYEQGSGWACTLAEELPPPLKCLIFGDEATLVDVDTDENGISVLGVLTKNKKKIRIPIQDVEVVDKKCKSLDWLGAYRYWIKNG